MGENRFLLHVKLPCAIFAYDHNAHVVKQGQVKQGQGKFHVPFNTEQCLHNSQTTGEKSCTKFYPEKKRL